MKVLLLPVVLQTPAHEPAKKLLVPVPPWPPRHDTILVVLHTLKALGAPVLAVSKAACAKVFAVFA
jgi:hypothetical protein